MVDLGLGPLEEGWSNVHVGSQEVIPFLSESCGGGYNLGKEFERIGEGLEKHLVTFSAAVKLSLTDLGSLNPAVFLEAPFKPSTTF